MIERPRAGGESDGWVSYEVIEISTTVLRTITLTQHNTKEKMQRKISLLSAIIAVTDGYDIEVTVDTIKDQLDVKAVSNNNFES